jgi:hypothetical protein
VSFSLGLTEEQQALREKAHAFARRVRSMQIPPRAFTAEEGGMAAAYTEPLDQRMDAPP